jgi:hypothetical protein
MKHIKLAGIPKEIQEEVDKYLQNLSFTMIDEDNNFYISNDNGLLITYNEHLITLSKISDKTDDHRSYELVKEGLSLTKLKRLFKAMKVG